MNLKTLLTLLGIGAALRLPLLPARFLWYDESFTALLARQTLPNLLAGTAADVHPPLYYLLTWPVMHIIDATAAPLWLVRLPALLFGLLSIWLMTRAAPAIGLDARATTALTAITALAPAQIWYASEARMYTLLTALFLAAAWAVGRRRWHWFTAAAVALVYTHNYGLIYCAALGFFALLRNWRDWKHVAKVGALTAAAWTPWAIVLAGQINEIDGRYWLEAFGHGQFTTSLVVLLAGFDLNGGMMLAAGALGIVLLMLAVTMRPPLGLWTMAALPLGLAAVASLTVTDLWLFRGFIPAQPFIAGLALWPFIRAWEKLPARILGLVLIIPVLLAGLVEQQITAHDRTADAATNAISVMRERWQPGEAVLHLADGSATHMGLKAPELPQYKLADCDHTVGALTDESRAALGFVEVASIDELRGKYRAVWIATGVGVNTPPCMAALTADLVGDNPPAFEQPFEDYFVDQIYIVDLEN